MSSKPEKTTNGKISWPATIVLCALIVGDLTGHKLSEHYETILAILGTGWYLGNLLKLILDRLPIPTPPQSARDQGS